jgi:predicted PurR-regulated permease PerM
MDMNEREPTPPWAIVLVVVAALVAVWIIGQTLGSVILLFALSVVLAMLLNPAVRLLRNLGLRRGWAVVVLLVLVVGAVAGAVALVINPIRNEVQVIQHNLPAYSHQATLRVNSVQHFFDSHGIKVNVHQRLNQGVVGLQHWIGRLSNNLLSYSLSVLTFLVSLIVVLVSTIYMLLDASRIAQFAERLGGPPAGALLRRTEHTLVQYIKAQVLISLIIGVSSGVAMLLLGVSGIFPPGETFAVVFGAWVFVAEFIPYVGPILGALPPILLALVTSPVAVIAVIITFIVIQQLEGHVVVPNIMGTAVGVHPLVVIFGLLIGEQIAGVPGVLLSIPMVVIIKELVTFAADYLAPDTPDPIEPANETRPTSPKEFAQH